MIPGVVVTQSAIGYFTSLSIDVSGLLILTIVLSLIGFRYGLEKLSALLLSTLTASFLTLLLPSLDFLSFRETYIFEKYDLFSGIIFLIFLAVSYLVISNMHDHNFQRPAVSSMFFAITLAIAISGTILAAFHLVGAVQISATPTVVDSFFQVRGYLFAWYFGILGVLYVSTR